MEYATEHYGKGIVSAKIDDYSLVITLDDGTRLTLRDDGQDCCEARYMRTDDEIQSLLGKALARIEKRDAPDIEEPSGEYHEVAFLEVMTRDGDCISVAFHNEHNGYYGGFGLVVVEEETA